MLHAQRGDTARPILLTVPHVPSGPGSGDLSGSLAKAFAGITAFVRRFLQGCAGARMLLPCSRDAAVAMVTSTHGCWVKLRVQHLGPAARCQGREEGLGLAWPRGGRMRPVGQAWTAWRLPELSLPSTLPGCSSPW